MTTEIELLSFLKRVVRQVKREGFARNCLTVKPIEDVTQIPSVVYNHSLSQFQIARWALPEKIQTAFQTNTPIDLELCLYDTISSLMYSEDYSLIKSIDHMSNPIPYDGSVDGFAEKLLAALELDCYKNRECTLFAGNHMWQKIFSAFTSDLNFADSEEIKLGILARYNNVVIKSDSFRFPTHKVLAIMEAFFVPSNLGEMLRESILNLADISKLPLDSTSCIMIKEPCIKFVTQS